MLPTARHVCREFGSQFLGGRQRGHAASNTRASAVSAVAKAVAEHARSEAEVIATIVCMVNQGRVRLCGTFKGARFDLTTFTAA